MPLIKTTKEHVTTLIMRMKPDHVREAAWFGQKPIDIAWQIPKCGGHVLSAVGRDGALLFIAGVMNDGSIFGNAALIFYLATRHYDSHAREALRMTRTLFEEEVWRHTTHRRIEQYLPPPYTVGIRFLEWLGWTKGDMISVGKRQAVHMYFNRG